MPPDADLNADLVREVARLGGLELTPERAADLAAGLAPILAGDAGIARLGLGTLRPVGPTWPEPVDE